MNARALTLALRLLTTACAGVALGTMTGCPFFFGCGEADTGWQPDEILGTMTDSDLHAFVFLSDFSGETYWDYLAVGANGTVVVLGSVSDPTSSTPFAEVSQVGTQTLRGAAQFEVGDNNEWWVVGDGGVLASSTTRGTSWSTVLLQNPANLHAIIRHQNNLVVVGDDIVLVRAIDGSWSEVAAPEGSWGQLRAAWSNDEIVYAVGLGGVVWTTADPTGADWTREEPGTDADLFDVGYDTNHDEVTIVGAAGTVVVRRASGDWGSRDFDVTSDLIAYDGGAVLTDDGRVIDTLVFTDSPEDVPATIVGARDLMFNEYSGLVVVGDGGLAVNKDYSECIGGRPFSDRTHGPLTADLVAGECWASTDCDDAIGPELDPRARQDLAAAWLRDGLYEHASVASFARFAAELLALGAPARLVTQAHEAARDEVHHAELCVTLAARLRGAPLDPGALPLPARVSIRAGDPVATAIAVFDEGCLNESVAACMAADAAGECQDPSTRAVLETIARDEARHATLAWSALRWLLDSYGEPVAAALRTRVASLGALAPHQARADAGEPTLPAGWGQLSPARQREVQARVVAELVRPLAHRMVAESVARV